VTHGWRADRAGHGAPASAWIRLASFDRKRETHDMVSAGWTKTSALEEQEHAWSLSGKRRPRFWILAFSRSTLEGAVGFEQDGGGFTVGLELNGPGSLDSSDASARMRELRVLYDAMGSFCGGNWRAGTITGCTHADCRGVP
jgi:hypothetical protein